MTSRRGSLNCLVIWLVNVPGVNLPAIEAAPVYWANLSTARWPYGRAEMAITSCNSVFVQVVCVSITVVVVVV
jgi:hypothetical protein